MGLKKRLTPEQQWELHRPRYFVGLDLGQASDYTALTILRRRGVRPEYAFEMGHLHRFPTGTSYPSIVEDVCAMLAREPLCEEGTSKWLAIDATGVGAPVVDMFRKARPKATLVPVMIHGGDRATFDGAVRKVPKRELVSAVQVCLQN